MNRIFCYLSLSAHQVNATTISCTTFSTPYWQADHTGTYIDDRVALSATQRFITPECCNCLMPYQDKDSGLVINADLYLTNRDELLNKLEIKDNDVADVNLVLHAYLKWHDKCTNLLEGHFSFTIWNPKTQELFAAIDQLAQIPLFYIHPKEIFRLQEQ